MTGSKRGAGQELALQPEERTLCKRGNFLYGPVVIPC